MPSIPPLAKPLRDDRVALRDSAERDIPEILIAYQDDPELHLRLGQERPPSGAQLGRWAEGEPAERGAGSHATLTVLQPGSDVCRGQVTAFNFHWDNGRVELGIWLAPQVRGIGMGGHALRLAGQWLLGDCGLARVQLTTEPRNEPMLRAARSAGFVYEGLLREYVRRGDRREDSAMLSLLPGDLEE